MCLGCVNGLLRSFVFLYLFDYDCIVCGIGGIDCCGRAMSPNGATLLQSPGCNEGIARNETLGKHGQKRIELRRSGTHSERLVCVVAVRGFAFVGKVPPLWGSIKNVYQ